MEIGEAVQRLVVFHVGDGGEYAIPIERVQEVVRYEPPRAIASERPWMLGVTSLRGHVLPVCDLAGRLGIPADGQPSRLLIASADDGTRMAFAVSAVDEIASVESSRIDAPAAWHDEAVSGVARIDDRIVVVLDPGRLGSIEPTRQQDDAPAALAPEPGATT